MHKLHTVIIQYNRIQCHSYNIMQLYIILYCKIRIILYNYICSNLYLFYSL